MNCWDILGIGPVANKAELKKAYAAQLKLHHPEDDPAGFQRLREAYEQALMQAKYRQQTKAVENNEALPQMTAAAAVDHPQEEPSKMLTNKFVKKVKTIYDTAPNKKAAWQSLLEEETYWSIQVKQQLNYRLLQFLFEKFQVKELNLSPAVWELFNQHFFWTQQEKKLYNIFSANFLDFVFSKIYKTKPPETAYPKYILYANFIIIPVLVLFDLLSGATPRQGALSTGLVMLVGGIMWGNSINFAAAVVLSKQGIFDFTAPYCKFCHIRTRMRLASLRYFFWQKVCRQCGKSALTVGLNTEIMTGVIFFLTFLKLGASLLFGKVVVVFGIMLLITVVDDVSQLILDKINLWLAVIGAGINLLLGAPSILEMAAGGLMNAALLLGIALLSKGRIGGGIIKLGAACGIVIGGKLALAVCVMAAIGMLLTGVVMINKKGWLFVGSGCLSGIGLMPLGLVFGWKLVFGYLAVFIVGIFISGILSSLKQREKLIPVAPFFMAATYLILLYKEQLSRIFSSMP